MFYDPGMKRTRHVWLIPPLGVGPQREGLVIEWRRRPQGASPPIWEAQVVHVDERDGRVMVEWIPSMYLVPVGSTPPSEARA